MTDFSLVARRSQAGIGIALTVIIVLVALSSLFSAPHGPASLTEGVPLAEPDAAHWLGTDAAGRDLVAALMSGTLTSLLLAWFATLVSLVIGIPIGTALALRIGAPSDRRLVLIGIMPAALCIGAILSAQQLAPALVVVLAIAIPGIVAASLSARAIMAPALGADYVSAARLAGLGWLGAGQRHVVPRVLAPLTALALELLAAAMLIEVTLSFAGLGVDGSGLSLGTLLRDGQQLARVRPMLIVAPGLVTVVTTLALLVAASGLREDADAAA